MSKRINILLIFITGLLIFTGCNATKIPRNYLPNPHEMRNNITGSWIDVTIHSDLADGLNVQLSGELIAIQSDTLFILSDIQLSAIKSVNIDTAILYIFKNQGGKFALITGLLIVPDIIGAIAYSMPGFLFLGVPVLAVGSAFAITEGIGKSNRLLYPGRNTFEQFRKFARLDRKSVV